MSPRDIHKRVEESRLKATLSVRELFKETHTSTEEKEDESGSIDVRPLEKEHKNLQLNKEQNLKQDKQQTCLVSSGPLRGVSTSLLDHIRAKEAAAKSITPEERRQKELLGIALDIARIVPTVFTANKKEVMLYDKVVEKCFKGLKSNYTTATIIECLDLLDKIAPEWVTIVQISRGKFMRINRDKYNLPQMLEAIKRYRKTHLNQNLNC